MRKCTTIIQNNHIPMFTRYRWSVLYSKTVLDVQERGTTSRPRKGKSQSIRLDQKMSMKYQKSEAIVNSHHRGAGCRITPSRLCSKKAVRR